MITGDPAARLHGRETATRFASLGSVVGCGKSKRGGDCSHSEQLAR